MTQETGMQPYRPQSAAIAQFDPEVEGELHDYDMRPPVVVLGQAGSLEATAGAFHRLDTDEEHETLTVVPVIVKKTRTRMPAEFSRDSRPLCWSEDGIAPAPGGDQHGVVGLCTDCQFYTAAPWDAKPGGCKGDYAAVLLELATGQPFLMRLRGTASRIARVIGSKGVYRIAAVTLYTDEVSTEKGRWWQLKAKVDRKLTLEEIARMREALEGGLRSASVEMQDGEAAGAAVDNERAGLVLEREDPPFPVAGAVPAQPIPSSLSSPPAAREPPRNVVTSGPAKGRVADFPAQPPRRSMV
ncbi:MAG: hypothetical protein Q8R28_11150 [Dehalococcoidia bacterium]|nr:hypothetical protein [Dehalococcoidia bacterium]